MANKIVLITGASRGLGKNGALQLAQAGFDVIVTYQHNAFEAEQVAEQVREFGRQSLALQLDVAAMDSLPDFIQRLADALQTGWTGRKLDAVIHNAGIGIHTPFVSTSMAQFDLLMNIHVKGPYFLTQMLLPLLAENARILLLSTGLTRFAIPGYSAYAMMKGAVETMSLYLAKELAGSGIRVNVLAPGAIETDFGGGAVRDNQGLNQFLASNTALGRVGQPDDIGAVMRMLLSDDAGWITAQRIEASGGMFL